MFSELNQISLDPNNSLLLKPVDQLSTGLPDQNQLLENANSIIKQLEKDNAKIKQKYREEKTIFDNTLETKDEVIDKLLK